MSLGKTLFALLGITTVAGISVYGIKKATKSPEKDETPKEEKPEEEVKGEKKPKKDEFNEVPKKDIPKKETKRGTKKSEEPARDPSDPIITMETPKEEKPKAAKFTIIDEKKEEVDSDTFRYKY